MSALEPRNTTTADPKYATQLNHMKKDLNIILMNKIKVPNEEMKSPIKKSMKT